MKKILSVILAALLVFAFCGVFAVADGEDGEEAAFDPATALGEASAESQFDIRLNAQLRYKPGEEIKVISTVRSIKHREGISVLTYDLCFDPEKVEIADTLNSDGTYAIEFKTPDKKAWENLTKPGTDDNDQPQAGVIKVGLANANTAGATAVKDGEITVTVRFKVKEDTDGDVFFWIPHASVLASDADFNNFVGSGSYVSVSKQPTKQDLVSELEDEVAPDPGAQFDLEISGPEGYNSIRKFDVTVTIKNIKATEGISGVDFLLKYDASVLDLVTEVGDDGVLKAVSVLPDKDAWENLTKLERNEDNEIIEGVIHVAYFNTTNASATATKDGDFSVTVSFIGKKEAEFATGIWTDSESIEGRTPKFDTVTGNGSYIVLDKEEFAFIPGDVNGNEKIDAQDYAMIKRHFLGSYVIPGAEGK